MKLATISIVLGLIVMAGLTIGMVFLQLFLSKRENRWLGLILPAMSFLFSLLGGVGQLVYVGQSTGELAGQIIMTLLITNIPTIIGIAIYASCRERFNRKREVEKMNLHDL